MRDDFNNGYIIKLLTIVQNHSSNLTIKATKNKFENRLTKNAIYMLITNASNHSEI